MPTPELRVLTSVPLQPLGREAANLLFLCSLVRPVLTQDWYQKERFKSPVASGRVQSCADSQPHGDRAATAVSLRGSPWGPQQAAALSMKAPQGNNIVTMPSPSGARLVKEDEEVQLGENYLQGRAWCSFCSAGLSVRPWRVSGQAAATLAACPLTGPWPAAGWGGHRFWRLPQATSAVACQWAGSCSGK